MNIVIVVNYNNIFIVVTLNDENFQNYKMSDIFQNRKINFIVVTMEIYYCFRRGFGSLARGH